MSEVALTGAVQAPARRGALGCIRLELPTLVTILLVALAASIAVVGADAYWLAALGREIVEAGGIPDGIPFATAPTSGWPNVALLGELAFYGVVSLAGASGLVVLQVGAVALVLVLVGREASAAGAQSAGTAVVLVLLFVTALPALVVARAQVFSVVLFTVLVVLLRGEARRPSRRIWLVVPLLAVWANLHGAVLVGLAVAGAYLVCGRLRRDPFAAVAVLACGAGALLATPSLERTATYYLGVLGNEAARRGVGFWAPLSFTEVTGALTIAGSAGLVLLVARASPSAWEAVAVAGLVGLTVSAGRGAVWLALFCAPLAARGVRLSEVVRSVRSRVALPIVAAALALLAFGLACGPAGLRDGDGLVDRAVAAAGTRPVLAEDMLAERVAYAGGSIVAGNPIDAFAPETQRLYLSWLSGSREGDILLAESDVVLVARDRRAQSRLAADSSFVEAGRDSRAVLYVRAGG